MTLTAVEFIRRFLVHVLPASFHRIRNFGLLGNRFRRDTLAHCRHLLHMPAVAAGAHARIDYRDRYEELTGWSLRTCPFCGEHAMREIEGLVR
jgi:hypothetical protein